MRAARSACSVKPIVTSAAIGAGAERIERVAGGAREQLAMAIEARRTRRDGVEHLLGNGEFGGLEGVRERVERLALIRGGLPL